MWRLSPSNFFPFTFVVGPEAARVFAVSSSPLEHDTVRTYNSPLDTPVLMYVPSVYGPYDTWG